MYALRAWCRPVRPIKYSASARHLARHTAPRSPLLRSLCAPFRLSLAKQMGGEETKLGGGGDLY